MRSQNINRWINKAGVKITLLCLLILGSTYAIMKAEQAPPALATDRTGALAGQTVTITGNGFQPGENVSLQVTHANGAAESGMGHEPGTVTADATGAFAAKWSINVADSTGNDFVTKATAVSGVATAAFGRIAQVQTDKQNYVPGETVTSTGSGFLPNEPVTLQIVGVPEPDPALPGAQPFPAAADAQGNLIPASWYVDPDELDTTLSLTALGNNSGLSAQWSFRDGNIKMSIVPQTGSSTPTVWSKMTVTEFADSTAGDAKYACIASNLNTGGHGVAGSVSTQAIDNSKGPGATVGIGNSQYVLLVANPLASNSAALLNDGSAFKSWQNTLGAVFGPDLVVPKGSNAACVEVSVASVGSQAWNVSYGGPTKIVFTNTAVNDIRICLA